MIRCDSNQRCDVCPIERLPVADDRVMAGESARSVIRVLRAGGEDVSAVKFSELVLRAEQNTAWHHSERLQGPVIGAVAINLAGKCKVTQEGI